MRIATKINLFSLSLLTVMTMAVILIGTFFINELVYRLEERLLALELTSSRQILFETLNRNGVRAAVKKAGELQQALVRNPDISATVTLFVIEAPNRVLFQPGRRMGESIDAPHIRQMFARNNGSVEYNADGERCLAVFGTIYPINWLVGLAVSRDALSARRNDYLQHVGGAALLILGIGAVITTLFVRRFAGRIRTTLSCVKQIEQGDLTVRIDHGGSRDEIGHLQAGVNAMSAQLQQRAKKQQRTETALRDSEERYRSLFQNSHTVMLLIDLVDGAVVDANHAAVQFYGYSYEELITLTIHQINCMTPEQVDIELERFHSENRTFFQFRHRLKNGDIRDVEIHAGPIEVGGRELLYSIVFDSTEKIRNQKERESLESQLRRMQKVEAIGVLAGGIAHDFNNMLTPILGYAEMGMDANPPESWTHDCLRQINKAGQRAKELVGQILTFSRQSDIEVKPVQVQTVLRELIKLSRSLLPSTIEIKEQIDRRCKPVLANPTQLHQIGMNLVTNAFHAMEDAGGVLEIKLTEMAQADLVNQIPSPKAACYACLSFSDTGVGIPPDVIERVFDPYFTTKSKTKGTGLGLSVVHGIVKRSKGEIVIRANNGQGTVVDVYLPCLDAMGDEHSSQTTYDAVGGAERILLVDDEVAVAKMMGNMLARLGYIVTTCTSSTDALAAFKAAPHKYDLVITDMTMPAMTGDQLIEAMRAVRSGIPVIVCTGFSDKLSPERAQTLGIDGYLLKPIIKTDLDAMIRRVVGDLKASKAG